MSRSLRDLKLPGHEDILPDLLGQALPGVGLQVEHDAVHGDEQRGDQESQRPENLHVVIVTCLQIIEHLKANYLKLNVHWFTVT